jgi:hypothetical protein
MPRPRNEQEREGDGKATRRRLRRVETADYASADAAILLRAITIVANTGGALHFGYTSDGGAFAIRVYGDGAPYTDYLKPSEDLNVYLTDLIEAWE